MGREYLIDYSYGELAPEDLPRVKQHLLECAACREELAALQRVHATLDGWQAPDAPGGLTERIMGRVRLEAANTLPLAGQEKGFSATPFLALAFGGLAAVISLALITPIVPDRISDFALAVVGILWAVLYGGTFLAAMGTWSAMQHLARVALLAGGLAVLFGPILSIPQVVEACSAWVGAAKGSIALNLLLFVVGGVYTAIPALIAHLAAGKQSRDVPVHRGFASGLLYLALIAPVFYLLCSALAIGVGVTWMAGMVAGALSSGPAGIWLAGQRATV